MAQQNGEGELDPAATTGNFQRFVKDNREPEPTPRRPVTPIVLGLIALVATIGIIAVVVLALA